jgi:Txe/YoeB family toxin of Txe-Axe toxin-antitoxin module
LAGAPLGNKNATKGKPFLEAVERAIVQSDGQKLRDCAEKLLECAANGESWAMEILIEKLDGREAQRVDARVTHEHRSVSDTASFIRESLGLRPSLALPESLPH